MCMYLAHVYMFVYLRIHNCWTHILGAERALQNAFWTKLCTHIYQYYIHLQGAWARASSRRCPYRATHSAGCWSWSASGGVCTLCIYYMNKHAYTYTNISIYTDISICMCKYVCMCNYIRIYTYAQVHVWADVTRQPVPLRGAGWEVGGWGRDPKKCTGRGWGMGSSTI